MPDIQRQLGEFTINPVGLGCMNLSYAYGPASSEKEASALLNTALDEGVNFLDTAALYGFGNNEKLLQKAVGHRRNDFTLASKSVLSGVDGKRVLNGRPEAITATIDASLVRLGTDCIDLMYLHRLDKNVPIEDSVGALVKAKEAGKIRALGLSEMSATTIDRAHKVHPITAVQSEYSLCVRNPEIAVLDYCRKHGINFVAFSPLARGLLSRKITSEYYDEGDIRASMPRFVEPQLSLNLQLVEAFNRLADDHRVTSAQLALAWLLAKGEYISVIPGTTQTKHLEDNLASASLELSEELTIKLDRLFPPGVLKGPRYNASQQLAIDTELFADEELA